MSRYLRYRIEQFISKDLIDTIHIENYHNSQWAYEQLVMELKFNFADATIHLDNGPKVGCNFRIFLTDINPYVLLKRLKFITILLFIWNTKFILIYNVNTRKIWSITINNKIYYLIIALLISFYKKLLNRE